MAQFKRFNTSDNPTRSDTTAAYPNGTLTWDDTNGLRLHDGSTLGGNAIGGGGGSIGSFGTDAGIGSGYAANNPAVLFSDDDMIIRTGGTSGHGTIGAMYIASSEELIIGHATTALTDNNGIGPSTFGTYINFDGNGMNLTSSITTADIQLQTTNGVYNHSWNFSHEGKIVFPNSNLLYSGQSTGETNLQIVDGTSSFKIYTHATSGAREWDFAADGSFTVPGVINSQAATGAVTVSSYDGSTTHSWSFGTDGSLTFPDGTLQTTAYRVMSVPPSTPWGAIVSYDGLSFLFDPTQSGSPAFNGGWGGGAGSYNTLIWSAEVYQQLASPNNLSFAVSTPVQYFNYNTASPLTETVLTPGDYFVMRILDVGTNRVYRATFLAGYNAASVGTETQCGAITVERLV